jgi:tetrathionate reductase subunit A
MANLEKQTRREFIKTTALLGGSAFILSKVENVRKLFGESLKENIAENSEQVYRIENELSKPENVIHTVCLQCNTGCGIKVKLYDGVAVKVEGNPYSPWTLVPSIKYDTPIKDSLPIEGALCPKGQAGIQTLYDPYRIRKVLKRAGKRGENKWIEISFEQAIKEIVEGGKLFKHVKGEENRVVPGLKDIWAVRDPKLASEMASEIEKIRKAKPGEEKKKAIEEFKIKFKDHLDKLIDPEHPDLGPKNNQFVFMWGRVKAGRGELIRRFVQDSLGSINAHGHTTVCQGSLYFTGKAMSEQFQEGKWAGGAKFYWQADTGNVKFLLAVGTAYIEGGYGPTHHARKLMDRIVNGDVKICVVDPRFSKIASKAWKWIPIKPGTEGALALAMIRWIIENKRFDEKFLRNANKAAANETKEPSWTNATWLVKIEKGEPTKFLRASEIGLPQKEKRTTADGKEWEFDPFVVMVNGKPTPFDPNDDKNPVYGDLFVDTEINGIRVKSALQIIYESAASKTIEEWAKICDVKVEDIIEVAREFTSYGKQAVADIHRGVSQHTNGFYNVYAFYTLNALVGNYDWKGGLIKATTYDIMGAKKGQPFDLNSMHPNKIKPFGVSIIRHEVKYEESTLFDGYPAKRPWYPLSSDIYQEIIPSIGDKYPYPVKILFMYMAAPTYALPGGQTNIEILRDVDKIPLIVACDITIGVASMYADYIFPDLTYLERWEFHGSHPTIPQKVQPVRNPAVAPIPETVKVFGEEMPISLEALILGIAEKMNLPGFGKNGFGNGMDFTRDVDFYLKMVANIAMEDKPVPDASDEEVEIFLKARRHLPKSVFDPQRWKKAVGDEYWRKVIYVLNRGGRFQDYYEAFDSEGRFKNKYGKLINLYSEKVATTKDSMTGKYFKGYAQYVPIRDVLDREVDDEKEGFDLHLITFREVYFTKSRTVADYWLLTLMPENYVLLNRVDAKRLGLKDNDVVKVVSKTNPEGIWDIAPGVKKPMQGKVKVIEGLRPGVVAFCLGFGNWATGSSDFYINGRKIKGDPRRGTGIHANAAMRLDDYLKNTCMLDKVGGSVSFYDTKVKLVKI